MENKKIQELVSQLTLEEKAGLTSGKDNWYTKAVERLGIPSVRTSDGPHGLRTQAGDTNSLAEGSSIPAVCFPAACTTAASFDCGLLRRMGEELGRECQALGVDVLLGPGVNIKRSPLCGRNFEYFSEDPLLAGELGAAFVKGVQSQDRGTSLKHFFANSQEHRRMDSSSEMDERTMREIYLPAFEKVVKEAQPWTIMASYNKIGGTYSTANKKYLTDLLRKEWGFEGLVTSDWGATHDRAAAVEAGCGLTMPAEDTDGEIVRAVQEGRLSEELLDASCVRLLELAFKAAESRKAAGVAVVFVGLTDPMEAEGTDRRHMHLPEGHNALVEEVCAANPNTVVVLHNGSPVEMPWVEKPRAILEAYLGGQAVGEAVVDVLYGEVNPSGRLPESFPKRLEDNPSYLYYFGEGGTVTYNEGLFVGYRYYESKKQEVLFPFGHGLSYTAFQYSSLRLDKEKMGGDEALTVSVTVTNTGKRAGKTAVQLYIAPERVEMIRPVRELKAFDKVELAPGRAKP